MRFFLSLLFLIPTFAWADISAVLIGVSDYKDGSGITDLNGPKNDVALMNDVLTRLDVAQIDMLADGVEGAALPTRIAILESLAAKAESAAPGDFVYIHFSGHGTQQQDLDGDETDGRDEVILPIDAGKADPGTGLITNAITDDELGQAIDRIRANGANVWLVLDSCHSGSGLRAGGAEVATRYVDPATLGVTLDGQSTRVEDAVMAEMPESAGGVIAFYAAQSSELAREIQIGTSDGASEYYGLFSSRLAARLDSGAGASFRQLFQSVLRDMNDSSVPGAARMQTPLWEGDLIDAAVFGDASTSSLRRFEVRGDQFLAGQVHGLSDGTLIGLVAEANAPADALIGHAQLELTDATSAFLRPVDATCAPRMDTPCAMSGTLPSGAKFGQVIARPVDLAIRFSAPIDAATGAPLLVGDPIRTAFEAAIDQSTQAASLSESDFDVEVGWDGTALWFGPRATLKGQHIGLRWQQGDRLLSDVVTQIAKAETLDRLLTSLTATTSPLNPNPVRIQGTTLPVSLSNVLAVDTPVSPIRECTRAQQQRDPALAATLGDAAVFKQCDGVQFEAQGLAPGARDVNRIHIDAKYCIHNDYARVEDRAAATALGGQMTLCSNCPDGYNAGDERVFIVVSEAANNSPALNLSGLIENCGTGFETRSARAVRVDDFLASLTQGRATRGNLGQLGLSSIWVDRYRWTILPKEIVLGGVAAE